MLSHESTLRQDMLSSCLFTWVLQDVMCMQSQVTAEAREEGHQIVKAHTDYFLSLIHADAREAAAASAQEREHIVGDCRTDGRQVSKLGTKPSPVTCALRVRSFCAWWTIDHASFLDDIHRRLCTCSTKWRHRFECRFLHPYSTVLGVSLTVPHMKAI